MQICKLTFVKELKITEMGRELVLQEVIDILDYSSSCGGIEAVTCVWFKFLLFFLLLLSILLTLNSKTCLNKMKEIISILICLLLFRTFRFDCCLLPYKIEDKYVFNRLRKTNINSKCDAIIVNYFMFIQRLEYDNTHITKRWSFW